MANQKLYTYPSPLAGYENAPPLPSSQGPNETYPPVVGLSPAYKKFPDPIDNTAHPGGFDAHIYFDQNDPYETKFATELRERILREFPELRTYKLWERPIGPHTRGMFEVNVLTTTQFGAFIPWLIINRGPLLALLHTNTGDHFRDHTQRATWLGGEVPVNTEMFTRKGL